MTEVATQPPLLIEEPPTFEDRPVVLDEVLREPWGPPPDEQLKRNIAMAGVIFPIVFVPEGDKLRIIEGRRRFQAAEAAGHPTVPGRILLSQIGVGVHALHLSGNAHASQNRVMDLFAVEEIMVATGERDPVEIARRSRVPLSTVKKILQLQALLGELKDAWMEGKFSNAVGVAAANLDGPKQRKLAKTLAANGTLTMKDVSEAKKGSVRAHQRKLATDNWKSRAADHLRKARAELEENADNAEDSRVVQLIAQALEALAEVDDE